MITSTQSMGLNSQTFERMFREHYLSLLGYARSMLSDEEQSREVVQAMFAQIWEKRANWQEPESLRSYLFRAVYHRALNVQRHGRVRRMHAESVMHQTKHTQADFTDPAEVDELKGRIEAAIGLLPPRCGQIFRLSRFDGLTYQQIANRLNISPKTVEIQMGKALRLLRKALQDYFPLWILAISSWIGEKWIG